MSEFHLKYRPDNWGDVIGQDAVVKSLRGVLNEGRSRSFLFTGPSGCGKTTLARMIAIELESELVELDAATRSGIGDVRGIQDLIRYKSLSGTGRTIILDECHMLSKSAWNALLKVIEEPPSGVHWVLCTTEPTKVPKTIITRCIRYDLRSVKDDDLLELIEFVAAEEELETPKEVLELCIEKAEGSPREALVLLAATADCKTEEEAAEVLRMATAQTTEVIDLCRALMKGTNWTKAMKLVNGLDGVQQESARIQICAYFGKVARGCKTPDAAEIALSVLEEFADPYPPQPGYTDLLLSIGRVVL